MSYITNTTANRLKINKGWKNPSFPETLPFYSRDNVFFFKLYLFLKAYFTLKSTKLIYCDLRISENYNKILYLVINSVPKKYKKKKKSYRTWYLRKTRSGLKYSNFRNAHFRHAVNLLYLDLPKLKTQFSAKLLPLSKQKLSKAFITKTRYKTWINFLATLQSVRNTTNRKYKNLRFTAIKFSSLNIKHSLQFKLKRLKNEIIVLHKFFVVLKQNKLFTKQTLFLYKTQLNKLKLKFAKLRKILVSTSNSRFHSYTKWQPNVTTPHFYGVTPEGSINQKVSRRAWVTMITRRINKIEKKEKYIKVLNKQWINVNKIVNSSIKISINNYKRWVKAAAIARLKKTKFLLQIKKNTRFLSKNLNTINLNSSENVEKQETQAVEVNDWDFDEDKQKPLNVTVLNDQLHKQLVYNVISAYIAYLKETNCINTQRSFAKFLTLIQSKNPSKISLTKFKTKPITFEKDTMRAIFQYRTVYTKFKLYQRVETLTYPTNLKLVNTRKYKKLRRGRRSKFIFAQLQKLRQKRRMSTGTRKFKADRFNSTVELKFVSSLMRDFSEDYKQIHKNFSESHTQAKAKKKIKKNSWKLRETFRHNYKTHAATLMKYQYKLGLQNVLRTYFKMDFDIKIIRPLSQFKNLNFFRLFYQLRSNTNMSAKYKKTVRSKLKVANTSVIPLRRRYILLDSRTARFNKINNKVLRSSMVQQKNKNTYVFRKEANIFRRRRRQELLEFYKSRFNEVRRTLIFRRFMPTASLFIKYLNPQIIADHIAQEFEKTKYHKSIIFGLTTALSSLPLARCKGYHIAISGRINSASKSRSVIIKRNVLVRQNFSSKVNFASAQARARIGSFGIKVWTFF